jgi:GT2 family glycosyltransferase
MSNPPVLDDMTVVIPTLGRDSLQGCLESIAAGGAWPARLIAVDQGRSERTAGWIEALGRRGLDSLHCPSDQRGVAAGRNRGIERVGTRFFAITDDDCEVEPGWLEALTRELRERPGAVVTGRVDAGSSGAGDGLAVSLTRGSEPRSYTRPLLKEDILFAGNMGCAVATWERVGPFDEARHLRHAEDNDWAYRALRAGVPILFRPAAGVRHLDWRSPEELLATYAGYAESQGGFYGKHLRRGDAFIALRTAVTYLRAARRTVAGALSGDALRRRDGWVTLKRLGPGILRGLRESS